MHRMMMRASVVSALTLASLCVCAAYPVLRSDAPAGHAKEVKVAAVLDCSILAVEYCQSALGCGLDKNNGKCISDPAAIVDLNCTLQNSLSGAAVTDTSKAFATTMKTLKDLNYAIMKNTSMYMEMLADASFKYDQNMIKYNQSLVKFNKEEFYMGTLESALEALQAACSAIIPPPPPTCPMDIEKAQEKIAAENMTCQKMWLEVLTSKGMVTMAQTLVDTAEAQMETATEQAAAQYATISSNMQDALANKDSALAYWNAIQMVCTSPSAVMPTKKSDAYTVVMRHGKTIQQVMQEAHA